MSLNAALFLQHLPEIERRSRHHFSRLGPEAREEAVAESTAFSWGLFKSATGKGREVKANEPGAATPAQLAWYSNRLVDAGRRFAGYTSTDLLETTNRRDRCFSLNSGASEEDESRHTPADPGQERPLDIVRQRHDWELIMSRLSRTARLVLKLFLRGESPTSIAQILCLSRARISQLRKEIATRAEELNYHAPTFRLQAKQRRG